MRIILNAPGEHHHTKEAVENELRESLPRLKRLLFQFRPEEKTLRANIVAQKNNVYRLTLSIRMPGKNLIVERTGHSLIPLVTEAKQSLFEQIKVQTAVIRKEHLRARSVQQGQAIQEAVGVSALMVPDEDEDELRDRFASRLRLVLQDLYSHVRRLIRFSQMSGDLPPDYLKPAEVVDDIIVRAYELFSAEPTGEMSPATLYQLADGILHDEIRNYEESKANTVSLDEEVVQDRPEWELSDLGDESMEYYQLEESLLYSDVMPDVHVPDPVRALNEDEQVQEIFRCLSSVDASARSAFLLNRVEGFEAYEIAWMQERGEEQVATDILRCEDCLKETYPAGN